MYGIYGRGRIEKKKRNLNKISLLKKPHTFQIFLMGFFVGLSIGLFMILFIYGKKDDKRSMTTFSLQQNLVEMDPSEIEFSKLDPNKKQDNLTKIHTHEMIDTELSDMIAKKVRVLCWVMTYPAKHYVAAIHVKATWGKRCDKLIFMSTENDPNLPSVALSVDKDERKALWGKTKLAMKYIYEYYYDEYDWFFKADDDTYAIIENLKYFLYYKNSSHPISYGCRLKHLNLDAPMDYFSGGAGYILSKEALRRFVKDALPNPDICKQKNSGAEDIELSKCLQAVGVELGDTLDSEDRNTFTPISLRSMLTPRVLKKIQWFPKMMYNPFNMGLTCCSDNLISTHYITPQNMYLMEYLIYHLRAFGRAYNPILQKNPPKSRRIYNKYVKNVSEGLIFKPIKKPATAKEKRKT